VRDTYDAMTTRVPHRVFAAGLAAWIVLGAIQWLMTTPLGHDETQYAIAARDLLNGDPPRWFHVSSGMSAVAIPGLFLDGERGLRVVPLVIGIGFILGTALLARRACSGATAAWSVAILAGCRPLIQRTTSQRRERGRFYPRARRIGARRRDIASRRSRPRSSTCGILIGSFIAVRLAIIILGAPGYEDLEILLSRGWLAFCVYTWLAPEIFEWMLKRELETVELREDY
jgi:hypothetical protein